MAWCPNCKTEYRDGIETCADCGATLVKELKEEATECVAYLENKEQAERLVSFLDYSGIKSACLNFDTKEDAFAVYVTAADLKEAKKLFRAFYQAEDVDEVNQMFAPSASETKDTSEETSTENETEESEEEKALEEEALEEALSVSKFMPETSLTYVKKKDRYEDLKSTAWIFLIFGIGGLIFVALNMAEVITLLSSWLQFIVLGAVSIGFLFVSIRSFVESKQIYTMIDQEEDITEKIKSYMKENFTADVLAKFDGEDAPEVSYLKKTEFMKKELLEQYEIDSEAYLEQLIEDYYTENFES